MEKKEVKQSKGITAFKIIAIVSGSFNNLNSWLKGVIFGTLLGILSAGLTFFVLSAPKVLYYLILFVFGPALRIAGLIRYIKIEIIKNIGFYGLFIIYYSLIGLVLGTISQLPLRKKRKKTIIIIVIGLLVIIHAAAAIYENSRLMRMPILWFGFTLGWKEYIDTLRDMFK